METFILPSGGAVQLRGLSGYEVMVSRKKTGDDLALNAFMLACAMDISEGAALEWMKEHLAGDFMAVVNEVQRLSGLSEDASKSG